MTSTMKTRRPRCQTSANEPRFNLYLLTVSASALYQAEACLLVRIPIPLLDLKNAFPSSIIAFKHFCVHYVPVAHVCKAVLYGVSLNHISASLILSLTNSGTFGTSIRHSNIHSRLMDLYQSLRVQR